jgi:hypothetical protein
LEIENILRIHHLLFFFLAFSPSFAFFLEQQQKRVGLINITRAFKELVLELDPVESQRVQEALQHIHTHQHRYSDSHEWEPNNEGASSLDSDRVMRKVMPGQ